MTMRGLIAGDVTAAFAALSPPVPVDGDPNTTFVPPERAPYVQLRFVEGAEVQRSIGGTNSEVVTPVLAYIDIKTPQGVGDGLAVELARVARDSLRRKSYPGVGRWKRFEAGPEGADDGRYRLQVVAVFWAVRRV